MFLFLLFTRKCIVLVLIRQAFVICMLRILYFICLNDISRTCENSKYVTCVIKFYE
ncbi:hypothetical protein BACCOPRO_00609 [Phocaeicola coprophilus DSM 18228 = JCM 13818]|uniref:Uncharacterized protein n=1 Tax=Phocaeicola coprophilus DSM 18228 = JCM 13818 TaxID=547042 RepID=S0F9C8_9BACT|nr:hypothetical protein BACCOPRO_00609 [Phocaeicola coprophilus DSM 18228 = JCM 13818]